ncbi:MAG: hypothetical protein ACP5OO_12230 [Chloroflexia bacterium]
MSNDEVETQQTHHAFLVAWGRFAEQIGLLEGIRAVKLKQKKYTHKPQTKVLQFLVANLSGLRQLQEISLAAHPLDKDLAVAQAWGQPAWADYTGVSRTLRTLSWDEVQALVQVLERIGQPFLDAELRLLSARGQRLRLDGDLTGIPVSNSSTTYPGAAFGHMDDEIRLGYQAGVVSMSSPTYGRLWLSVAHRPGDTVSCTQAEALVLAAEARLGRRPRRRTELLRQRIEAVQEQVDQAQQRVHTQQQAVESAECRLVEAHQQEQERETTLEELAKRYQERQRQERPTSRLAQARRRLQTARRRCQSRGKASLIAKRRLAKSQARLAQQQAELAHLQQRLERFEQDNAANPDPVEVEFRLDAGFGTYDNIALLIEMGYELYIKPYSHQVTRHLRGQVNDQTTWQRVGANAEMVAWRARQLRHCPYPLDVALERFYTGTTLKHSTLLHFGSDPVTEDLPGWFAEYNGRQTIEAGVKEGKQVFYLQRIKVRSEPAIYLQECFVLFAANFIRWATLWLAEQNPPAAAVLNVRKMGIKRQVQVAAHVSAQVSRGSEGWLLRFSETSTFAGQALKVPGGAYSPPG